MGQLVICLLRPHQILVTLIPAVPSLCLVEQFLPICRQRADRIYLKFGGSTHIFDDSVWMDSHIHYKKADFLYIFSINSSAARLSKNGQLDHLSYFWLPRRCESRFNIVLEKLNVVGVWYTNDKIILTGMDWLLCVFHNFSDHLFLIIREPGYWYQQPLSDYKKCQIAVCSSVAYGTHWDPQWQPDTTGVVITPLQQIHIDNRGQPACGSLMGLGWGCPIDCPTDWALPGDQIVASHELNRVHGVGHGGIDLEQGNRIPCLNQLLVVPVPLNTVKLPIR